eukprot:TRINITY_DN11769_c0_g1_i1.p1 TRINITY_DN11769_c0_g1~~TRINITY_DN11769_c0_g1_i1.p1  ORF type:complete len:381 (+),score=38.82 TRINITY_DN11769_c0_g1_i1:72-1145(+)
MDCLPDIDDLPVPGEDEPLPSQLRRLKKLQLAGVPALAPAIEALKKKIAQQPSGGTKRRSSGRRRQKRRRVSPVSPASPVSPSSSSVPAPPSSEPRPSVDSLDYSAEEASESEIADLEEELSESLSPSEGPPPRRRPAARAPSDDGQGPFRLWRGESAPTGRWGKRGTASPGESRGERRRRRRQAPREPEASPPRRRAGRSSAVAAAAEPPQLAFAAEGSSGSEGEIGVTVTGRTWRLRPGAKHRRLGSSEEADVSRWLRPRGAPSAVEDAEPALATATVDGRRRFARVTAPKSAAVPAPRRGGWGARAQAVGEEVDEYRDRMLRGDSGEAIQEQGSRRSERVGRKRMRSASADSLV